MATLTDFFEARLKEDTDLPLDDALTKHHINELLRALERDDAGELSRDAWFIAREIVRLHCLRYKDHPEYNPAWKPLLANCITVAQRVVLGADQPAVDL